MILNILRLFLIFLSLTSYVFAKGGADSDADAVMKNNEWVLCITEFDTSSLTGDKTNISSIAARELMEKFSAISFHTRISPEYAYYEEYEWAKIRSAAAKSLAAKAEERARFIFQGEPDWKYRQNIKRVDSDIEKLRIALEEADSKAPLINNEPVFKLTSGNMDLVFPAAPASGGEVRFCVSQRADAALFGSIYDYHGRYFLSVKLFTLYNKAFIWEDSVIFSHNDLKDALDEVIKRLVIVLSGNRPAALAIKSQPEDALILVNRTFAGRGETGLVEYPPGTVIVSASAPDHESITFETELKPGELTEISLMLNPVEFGDIEILSGDSGYLYHGALYVGEAPLTLRLPVDSIQYLEMNANSGKKGSIVFNTSQIPDFSHSVELKTGKPLKKGKVERVRKHYYWVWGAQWITGIAAWIGYWSYAQERAYFGDPEVKMFQDGTFLSKFSLGSIIAFGATSAYGIFQMVRYLIIASKDETRLPKTDKIGASRKGRVK
ncbi:MAG: hypothetical protein FWB95_02930 [Treponema sp.]|nr:hypothetical protein [Treponema sp.]